MNVDKKRTSNFYIDLVFFFIGKLVKEVCVARNNPYGVFLATAMIRW